MLPANLELVQDRIRSMHAEAALQRESRKARAHERMLRQARRAEHRIAWHAEEATRLRAQLAALEAEPVPA